MASKLQQIGGVKAKKVAINVVKKQRPTIAATKFDYKKIAVSAGVGVAGFLIVKALRPENNIMAVASLVAGGVVGYFAYDVVASKQSNFANLVGTNFVWKQPPTGAVNDCRSCCNKCVGKCTCSHNMCTCDGKTVLLNY